MTQNNVSRLEDESYGKQTLTSLKRVAEALDVALVVRFVPFSQYIDWLSGTPFLDEGIGPNAMAVPSFEDEEKLGRYESDVRYFEVFVSSKIATPIKEAKPVLNFDVKESYSLQSEMTIVPVAAGVYAYASPYACDGERKVS
jgi:hypothetical protein